jgi:hypothetical protein
MRSKLFCRLLGVLLFAGVTPAHAAMFPVNSGYDLPDLDPGNGLCVAYIFISPPFVLPFCTLRAAIQEANALPGPDVIELGSGTYSLSLEGGQENLADSGDLDILDTVEIRGQGADHTIIDGAALDRVIDIPVPGISVTLRGISIVNGRLPSGLAPVEQGGGAVRNRADLFIRQSRLSGSTVEGDRDSDRGGGLLNQGNCTITTTTIENNTSCNGGGIMNDSTGALFMDSGTVSHNTAASGGGLAVSGTARLINSTLSGNFSLENGGAISNLGSTELVHCTLAGNTAAHGGGILNRKTVTLLNTLLADNPGNNCLPETTLTSQGFNLDSDGTCRLEKATDLILIDPELGPLADNGGATATHALPYSSPARDRGTMLEFVTLDQRGKRRSVGPFPDIGAFEAAPPPGPAFFLLFLEKSASGRN